MKYLSSMALMAGFASSRPQYVHSEDVIVSSNNHKSLRTNNAAAAAADHRNLQAQLDMTNSITEGPVTRQELELIQSIIQKLSQVSLPEGVDLTKVNVAVIVTEVLQELGIDAAASDGDLDEAEMELIIQKIIEKAAEQLGVIIDTVTDTTTTPLMTTNPTMGSSCACAPLSYTFTINLSQNCATDTFIDNDGVEDTVCQILTSEDGVEFDTLTVFDVQFLEVDTSGNLIVINQDDTYTNVSLSSGDTISFDSISAKLDPDEPLSSQPNYVPGGVLISLRAKIEGSETIVTNRVGWMYTNSCDSLPTSVGDAIGWITLTDQTGASPAFCNAAPPISPTNMPTSATSIECVPNGRCPEEGATCASGEESCCGETFNSLECECSGGEWLCIATDACLRPDCDTTTPSAALVPSPTKSPTPAPVASTDPPSSSPTKVPTPSPVAATDSPTTSPTKSPTPAPIASTDPPTSSPTKGPTPSPVAATDSPTTSPTKRPTFAPVANPFECVPNGRCPEEGATCASGEESCCGETFNSLECECSGGEWLCIATDACFRPDCDTDAPSAALVPSPTTTSSTTSGKSTKSAKSFTKAAKSMSDPMAKTIKPGDASMPAFAKTAKTKQEKSAATYFISKSMKSHKEYSLSSKSAKHSKASDAKAHKISSKAKASLSMTR